MFLTLVYAQSQSQPKPKSYNSNLSPCANGKLSE